MNIGAGESLGGGGHWGWSEHKNDGRASGPLAEMGYYVSSGNFRRGKTTSDQSPFCQLLTD